MSLASDLAGIASLPQQQRLEQTQQLATRLLGASPVVVEDLEQLVAALTQEDVPLTLSRQVIGMLANSFPKLDAEAHKQIATFTTDKISQRVSFEDQLVQILEQLAKVHEQESNWTSAARVLARLPLESSNRTYSDQRKADVYVKIAQLFLEDLDSVSAESYINRAAAPVTDCPDDKGLQLRYKVCYARILDSKRKFMEAAQWYYRLSLIETGEMVAEEEVMTALAHSITCAILAPAGPSRSRILAMLYKDERSSKLGQKFTMLTNMFFNRIIPRKDVVEFSENLPGHQIAKLSDGTTVLDRAITEHNILSASKIYNNIHIDQLGTLLEVPSEKAEELAARMVSEGRMSGSINQIEGVLYFDNEEILATWNAQVEGVCQAADDVWEQVLTKHPDLLA